MIASETFQIVIGDGWREAVQDGSAQPLHLADTRVDFGRIRDWVNIVVGGARIGEQTDEDSIFYLMRDILAGVDDLLDGQVTTRISYYNGPWELVLQRRGDQALITFYRSGSGSEVVIKDHPVVLSSLAEEVVRAAENLVERALSLDPHGSSDPLIATIERLKKTIQQKLKEGLLPADHQLPEPIDVTSSRWLKPRKGNRFSFGFKFEATGTDVLVSDQISGSDLSSLLLAGRMAAHAQGKRMVLPEGFLFMQVERMLETVRDALAAWEDGRQLSLRRSVGAFTLEIKLSKDDGFGLALEDLSGDESVLRFNDLTIWDFTDAVLGVARELRRKVIEVNYSQRRNLRLAELARESRRLTFWSKSLRRETIINPDVDRYKRSVETRRAPVRSMEISGASRIGFRENWRMEVEGLDLSGTMLCGDVALIQSRGALFGTDARTGAILWKRSIDSDTSRMQRADRDGLVRVSTSGLVEYLDILSGLVRWTARLAPRSGGAPVLLVAEQDAAPGMVITAEEENRLVALDIRTGEKKWRYSTDRGGRFSLRRYGRLLYVAGGENMLQALDLETGELVWRFSQRTKFVLPPAIANDTLIMPGGRTGHRDGRLFAMDPYSGELKWKTEIGGGVLTSPAIAGDTALVAVRHGNRQELVACNVSDGEEAWRYSCQGWAESCSLLALDDGYVVNSAGGVVRLLEAATGSEQWVTVLGPVCSEDVPLKLNVVRRGGVLFVPADTVYVVRPDDGHLLHSFGGEPPVPDHLVVEPDCSMLVAEESGHVASYSLAQKFGVLQGGAE